MQDLTSLPMTDLIEKGLAHIIQSPQLTDSIISSVIQFNRVEMVQLLFQTIDVTSYMFSMPSWCLNQRETPEFYLLTLFYWCLRKFSLYDSHTKMRLNSFDIYQEQFMIKNHICHILISLQLLIQAVGGAWIDFTAFQTTIPSSLTSYQFNVNDQVIITLSWTLSMDLDLYLYKDGKNILSRSSAQYYERGFTSSNPQVVTATIDATGKYWLRVDSYNTNFCAYTLNINVNGVNLPTIYNTVENPSRTVQQFNTQNNCRIKIVYTGPLHTIQMFQQGINLNTGTPILSQTVTSSPAELGPVDVTTGNWNLVIVHNLDANSGITTTTDVFIQILTDTASQCINFCTNKNYSVGMASGASNVCQCITSFLWNSGNSQCEINCASISMTSGTVSTNSCTCQTNFIWNQSIFRCEVPCNTITYAQDLVNGTIDTCVCQTNFQWLNFACSLDCTTKQYGVSLVVNQIDVCQCQALFVWNTTTKTCVINCSLVLYQIGSVPATDDVCQCQTLFTWDAPSKACVINCSQMSYTTILDPGTVDVCQCQTLFAWDIPSKTCVIDCSLVSYTTILEPGTVDVCQCEALFTWDAPSKTCVINCSLVSYTTIRDPGTVDVCQCQTLFAWDTPSKACVIDCSLVSYTTVLDPGTVDVCQCEALFAWEASSKTCVINCSLVSYTTVLDPGTVDVCQCQALFAWDSPSKACVIDCSLVSYTTVLDPGTVDICQCQALFAWDAPSKTCVINCSLVSYTTVLDPGTVDICQCQTLFAWDTPSKACVIDCSLVSYTTVLDPGTVDICQCQTLFAWDTPSKACVIDCSLVSYTTVLDPGTVDFCQCQALFAWEASSKTCVINCSLVSYTTVLDPGTVDICQCQALFAWDSPSKACVIDCSLVSYTTVLDPGTVDVCQCQALFAWDSPSKACVIDCSLVSYTTVLDPGTVDVCQCQALFAWDASSKTCVINCSQVSYTTILDPGTVDVCQCQALFAWDAPSKACVIDCSLVSYTTVLDPGTVDVCQCQTLFAWDAPSKNCVIDCSLVSYTTVLDPGTVDVCQCQALFAWDAPSKNCVIDCSLVSFATVLDPGTVDICQCSAYYIWDTPSLTCTIDCSSLTGCSTCIVLTGSLLCTSCSNTYYLQNIMCFSCPSDCFLCNNNTGIVECTQCQPGFRLFNNSCAACTAQNCLDCPNLASQCAECESNFDLQFDKTCKRKCDSIVCKSCINSASECSQCVLDFQLQPNKTCKEIKDSSFLSNFTKVILTLSILLCILGLPTYIAAAFTNILAGLEIVFAIQYTWLMILWLPYQLPPPTLMTTYMQFVCGYNIPFVPPNNSSDTPPQNLVFSLSDQSFASNYNLVLLLSVIPLLSAFSFKIAYHYISGTKKPKVHQCYNKSLQLLMCSCFFNLQYFVSCAVIFFKGDDLSDSASLALISLQLCIFLGTVAGFIYSSTSFGKFRISYAFHSVNLLGGVLLLSLLPEHTWAPAVLQFVFILYTFVFKPFETASENFRSIFCLLLMINATAFRAYISYAQPEQTSTEQYVWLIFMQLGLCLGIIWAIYELSQYYMKKNKARKINHENAEDKQQCENSQGQRSKVNATMNDLIFQAERDDQFGSINDTEQDLSKEEKLISFKSNKQQSRNLYNRSRKQRKSINILGIEDTNTDPVEIDDLVFYKKKTDLNETAKNEKHQEELIQNEQIMGLDKIEPIENLMSSKNRRPSKKTFNPEY